MNDELEIPKDAPPVLQGPSAIEITENPLSALGLLLEMKREQDVENERAERAAQDLFERQMDYLNKWRKDRGLSVVPPIPQVRDIKPGGTI